MSGDLFSISKKTMDKADELMSFNLKVPDGEGQSRRWVNKRGEKCAAWAEHVDLISAHREKDTNALKETVIRLIARFKVTHEFETINGGREFTARLSIVPAALGDDYDTSRNGAAGQLTMTNMSIGRFKMMAEALGYAPNDEGDFDQEFVGLCFPAKEQVDAGEVSILPQGEITRLWVTVTQREAKDGKKYDEATSFAPENQEGGVDA